MLYYYMSLYPPPSANVPVFNPELFTNINGGVSYGSVGTGSYLAFPTAQGAETWTNGTSTSRIDSSGVALSKINGVTLQGVALNGDGIAYNDGTTISTQTWGNIQKKIDAVSALSTASNASTLNINNAVHIQNGETSAPPTSFIGLSAISNHLQMNLCQDGVNASYGTAGDVLHSGGATGSMYWGAGGSGGSQSLSEVLAVGNTASNDITITGAHSISTEDSNKQCVMKADSLALNDSTTGGISILSSETLTLSIDNGTVIPKITLDGGQAILDSASMVLNGDIYGTFPCGKIEMYTTGTNGIGDGGTTNLTVYGNGNGDSHQSQIRNIYESDEPDNYFEATTKGIGTASVNRDNPLGAGCYTLYQHRANDVQGGYLTGGETQITNNAFATYTADVNAPTDPTLYFNTFVIQTDPTTQKTFVGASDQIGNYFEITDNNTLQMTSNDGNTENSTTTTPKSISMNNIVSNNNQTKYSVDAGKLANDGVLMTFQSDFSNGPAPNYSSINIYTSGDKGSKNPDTTTTSITVYSATIESTNQSEVKTIIDTDEGHHFESSNIAQYHIFSPTRDNPMGTPVYNLLQNRGTDGNGGVLNIETQVTSSGIATFTADLNDPTNPDAFFNTFKIQTDPDTQTTFLGANSQSTNSYFEFVNNRRLEIVSPNVDATGTNTLVLDVGDSYDYPTLQLNGSTSQYVISNFGIDTGDSNTPQVFNFGNNVNDGYTWLYSSSVQEGQSLYINNQGFVDWSPYRTYTGNVVFSDSTVSVGFSPIFSVPPTVTFNSFASDGSLTTGCVLLTLTNTGFTISNSASPTTSSFSYTAMGKP